MRLEEWDLRSLRPYPLNPRNNDDAVPYVQRSIEKYGYKVFIVVDTAGVIIAGHTRWRALCNINEFTGDYSKITVIVADDLTEQEIKEFRIVDNQVGGIADWDYQTLKIELETLPNFNLEDFGHIAGLDGPVIAPEILNEPELKEKKFQLKIGHETHDWNEAEYHEWAGWVVNTFGMSPIEFAVRRLMIDPADREAIEHDSKL